MPKTRIDIVHADTGEVRESIVVNDTTGEVSKFFGPDLNKYYQCDRCDEWFLESTGFKECPDYPGDMYCQDCGK